MRDGFAVQREMGYTRAEFIGWLPGATRHASFQINDDLVTVEVGRLSARYVQKILCRNTSQWSPSVGWSWL